jgi:hypothetical protein
MSEARGAVVPLSPIDAVKAVVFALALGTLGAVGWAVATHFTPLEIGFIAWGIGWLAGTGVLLGNGGRTGPAWGALAVSIAVACFALAKLFAILLRVLQGNEILDWWGVYQNEYYFLDVLWIAFAAWPAWSIGTRGRS